MESKQSSKNLQKNNNYSENAIESPIDQPNQIIQDSYLLATSSPLRSRINFNLPEFESLLPHHTSDSPKTQLFSPASHGNPSCESSMNPYLRSSKVFQTKEIRQEEPNRERIEERRMEIESLGSGLISQGSSEKKAPKAAIAFQTQTTNASQNLTETIFQHSQLLAEELEKGSSSKKRRRGVWEESGESSNEDNSKTPRSEDVDGIFMGEISEDENLQMDIKGLFNKSSPGTSQSNHHQMDFGDVNEVLISHSHQSWDTPSKGKELEVDELFQEAKALNILPSTAHKEVIEIDDLDEEFNETFFDQPEKDNEVFFDQPDKNNEVFFDKSEKNNEAFIDESVVKKPRSRTFSTRKSKKSMNEAFETDFKKKSKKEQAQELLTKVQDIIKTEDNKKKSRAKDQEDSQINSKEDIFDFSEEPEMYQYAMKIEAKEKERTRGKDKKKGKAAKEVTASPEEHISEILVEKPQINEEVYEEDFEWGGDHLYRQEKEEEEEEEDYSDDEEEDDDFWEINSNEYRSPAKLSDTFMETNTEPLVVPDLGVQKEIQVNPNMTSTFDIPSTETGVKRPLSALDQEIPKTSDVVNVEYFEKKDKDRGVGYIGFICTGFAKAVLDENPNNQILRFTADLIKEKKNRFVDKEKPVKEYVEIFQYFVSQYICGLEDKQSKVNTSKELDKFLFPQKNDTEAIELRKEILREMLNYFFNSELYDSWIEKAYIKKKSKDYFISKKKEIEKKFRNPLFYKPNFEEKAQEEKIRGTEEPPILGELPHKKFFKNVNDVAQAPNINVNVDLVESKNKKGKRNWNLRQILGQVCVAITKSILVSEKLSSMPVYTRELITKWKDRFPFSENKSVEVLHEAFKKYVFKTLSVTSVAKLWKIKTEKDVHKFFFPQRNDSGLDLIRKEVLRELINYFFTSDCYENWVQGTRMKASTKAFYLSNKNEIHKTLKNPLYYEPKFNLEASAEAERFDSKKNMGKDKGLETDSNLEKENKTNMMSLNDVYDWKLKRDLKTNAKSRLASYVGKICNGFAKCVTSACKTDPMYIFAINLIGRWRDYFEFQHKKTIEQIFEVIKVYLLQYVGGFEGRGKYLKMRHYRIRTSEKIYEVFFSQDEDPKLIKVTKSVVRELLDYFFTSECYDNWMVKSYQSKECAIFFHNNRNEIHKRFQDPMFFRPKLDCSLTMAPVIVNDEELFQE